jgi:1,2-diacylglycerol 3-alpha-glucosyltransferase
MRIGIVAYWFNRGQGVFARHLRSALDELGHETFVLARPTKEEFRLPSTAMTTDVWAQPGVTPASSFMIPEDEYLRWASENDVELAFFDQNYGFDEIAALRRSGVITAGRFVWERFSDEHLPGAREAFDVVYSLTAAERERYATMGVSSPRLEWGIHPELLEVKPKRSRWRVSYHYHGGLLGRRKPFKEVVEAFRANRSPRLRLVFKAQMERKMGFLRNASRKDPRIKLVLDDLPTAEHLQLFADCDVCLAPARWEGLGLHLYEAIAFGMPIITNDKPPMSELVRDGESGILVRSVRCGEANSGIPAWDPEPEHLRDAIGELGSRRRLRALREGTLALRDELSWERALGSLDALVSEARSARSVERG